jgi:tRNA-Thr(GGU) m(6)t(6)A37 methyltransferase TsaA
MNDELKIIAHIETDFPEKFGIPRQSGLVAELKGTIVFEPEYRNPDAIRGIDGYDYLWLLWKFEVPKKNGWSATVKPPRLGGNTTMGVFATRSPFRPNSIGLSSVRLESVELTSERGPLLHVSGVDLRDHTPIYDIKPYLPYVDSHPDARGGFADAVKDYELQVEFPEELLAVFPPEKQRAIIEVLKQDPRPSYQNDPTRRYGVSFAGYDVHFTVDGEQLSVFEVTSLTGNEEENADRF